MFIQQSSKKKIKEITKLNKHLVLMGNLVAGMQVIKVLMDHYVEN